MSKKLAIAMFGQKRLSREGGVEIVVKELCTRMAQNGCDVTCYNRAGHHVSGAEYDDAGKTEYEGIRQKSVPTIERRGLAAVSSSAFAALYSAFGKYDVVHIHAEGPAFFAWLPKMFGKRVVVTVHGIDYNVAGATAKPTDFCCRRELDVGSNICFLLVVSIFLLFVVFKEKSMAGFYYCWNL